MGKDSDINAWTAVFSSTPTLIRVGEYQKQKYIYSTTKAIELCEGVSNSFVGGEDQHLKTMWKNGKTIESKAKLTIAVNFLPQWENPQDTRRIYLQSRDRIWVSGF